MTQVIVLDLGSGNLRSVAKAAEYACRADTQVKISRDPGTIKQADKIIMPGQGAIDTWLSALIDDDLKFALLNALKSKPVLGICVGMQALFEYDHEHGGHDCLGLFKGEVVRFEDGQIDAQGLPMKVPQMGWNRIKISQPHPLWSGISDDSWFYFVHSYYVTKAQHDYVVGQTQYTVDYASAVAKDNIFAIQCHPEKSHHVGLKLIENFLNWTI